jgi:fructan beta-fructosidase
MANLPDNDLRVIQIAWMDHWNGGIGETIWERNATFPVTLGLVTYKGQQRTTRNPIKEISSLYESSNSWDAQVIEEGDNLLSDVKSKTFDLTAEFDLTQTTATQIQFKVANKTIVYDISEETLLSESCFPNESNHVTIRILVDWGQLEVFAQNGVYSYSEQFAFTPERNDLELISDGTMKLVSMELHEIKRTWE